MGGHGERGRRGFEAEEDADEDVVEMADAVLDVLVSNVVMLIPRLRPEGSMSEKETFRGRDVGVGDVIVDVMGE